MKILGNPPFSLLLVIYLVTFTIWVIIAHDIFIGNNQPNEWTIAQTAAVSSPAPVAAKKQESTSQVSSPTVLPTKSEEPAGEKPPEKPFAPNPEKAEGLPVSKPAEIIRPSEPPQKGSSIKRGSPAKSLRSEDWKLPTGDLRTGVDSKPMGNLRSPTESNIDGSLRPDENSLPSGSLRKEEQSLPTGSLR